MMVLESDDSHVKIGTHNLAHIHSGTTSSNPRLEYMNPRSNELGTKKKTKHSAGSGFQCSRDIIEHRDWASTE
jgi:hypothetical protein